MDSPPLRPLRHRSRRWIAWLAAGGVVALGAAALVVWGGRSRALVAVHVQRVSRGPVRDLVSAVAAGRVAAKREAQLRAEIAGTVLRLEHRRGERVATGAPILLYDAEDLRGRLRVAEAAVGLGRAQAAQSEAAGEVARQNFARASRLQKGGAGTAAEVEGTEGQLHVAQHSFEAARAAVQEQIASVLVARDALSKTIVRAPFAALILDTFVEQGEATVPGSPLAAIADTAELHVDASLDEADLGRVRVGMPVDVSLDAFPGQRLAGVLSEIAPSVTREPNGSRSIAIRVFLRPDDRLRVGMSADVDIVVATRDAVLWVTPGAVLGRGTARSVYVVDGAGIAHKRQVEIGIATWEAVEVTRGLAEGDRVVVTLAATGLDEGARVRVDEETDERGRRGGGG